ncbi:hypothetical protein LTS18_001145, partial [Coniosporium uncinatum]
PPGGTFRTEILQGFSFLSDAEMEDVIREASQRFQGTSYNLLTNNCNHFTNYLCMKLTGKSAPGYLNRAANIGVALPCVVPREWVNPPDYDTSDGALVDEYEDDDDGGDERAGLIRDEERRRQGAVMVGEQRRWDEEMDRIGRASEERSRSRDKMRRDTSGRPMPAAERAPVGGS